MIVLIGQKQIDNDREVFVVAEIGKNFIQTEEDKSWEEYLENAKQLVWSAKEAGADAVKFQIHNVEDEQLNVHSASPHFLGAERYDWVKRNTEATPFEFWSELKDYCGRLGIIFFSTPMSRGAARFLEKVGVPLWKVGSGDILDFVMLDFLTSTGSPIMLSSGMSTLAEVDKAINFLKKRQSSVILMHCVSKYPCPEEDLALGTITFFEERYGIPVGFSDHSLGYSAAWTAVELGAVVIEKHLTLDRNLWGPDHKTSLIPDEFKELVRGIRKRKHGSMKSYAGTTKILDSGEEHFRPVFRKSLVAGESLRRGQVLKKDSLYAMRPRLSLALPSEDYERVLGKRILKDLKKYDPITLEILEDNNI